MSAHIAVLGDLVPRGGVADVIDRHVVVLAPEERDGSIALAPAEHVARGDLTLPLGNDPVLDAQPLAAVRIGPAGDVPGGENTGGAGFEIFIDEHAAIDCQPGLSREIDAGPHADPDHDQLGVD